MLDTTCYTSKKPLDIILLAGQSNAQGLGVGNTDDPFISSDRLWQLKDEHCLGCDLIDAQGHTDWNRVFPTTYHLEPLCEQLNSEGKPCGCFANKFAELYEKKYLQEGRNICVIKTAVAGTGFHRGEWLTDGVLFLRMKQMIEELLSLNPQNRIVCVLWHQGEHDAWEKRELPIEDIKNAYIQHFGTFVKDLFQIIGEVPLFAGGFVDSWKNDFLKSCEAVEEGTQEILKTLKQSGFSTVHELQSNKDHGESEDNIHFCRDSQMRLGRKYFENYERALEHPGFYLN